LLEFCIVGTVLQRNPVNGTWDFQDCLRDTLPDSAFPALLRSVLVFDRFVVDDGDIELPGCVAGHLIA
jgi:hypothetical protein